MDERLRRLIDWFKDKDGVIVAFSGGVDSTLVTYAAHKALGSKVLAVTADSATLPPGELEEAVKLAEKIGVRHRIIKVDELKNRLFASNPPDRCYYCKKELIEALKRIAEEEGIETIVDGSNADDLKDFRPGLKALKELGVRSPLAEIGLKKKDVRELSRLLDLPTADKPAMACLSSRIPYWTPITIEKLRRIGEAESFIRKLTGVKLVRVRDHGDIARIEVGREERKLLFDEKIMDAISEKLRSLGYTYVTMELSGYRPGSLNEPLGKQNLATTES